MSKNLLLYLDANVYLGFYAYSSDDLDQLRNLTDLVKKKRVKLLLPEQTKHEFGRNRERKIAKSIDKLKGQKLRLEFPHICRGYPEWDELRELQKSYTKKHSTLIESISDDAARHKLQADNVIKKLFKRAEEIADSGSILENAHLRVARENPPGKKAKLGDAINWESLLDHAAEGEDLHLVTSDNDFVSPLDPTRLLPFLSDEWEANKEAKVHFYPTLSQFLQVNLPDIKLSERQEIADLIAGLSNSNSFAETHAYVARLLPVSEFTQTEAEQILIAATTNDQIYWIIGDDDVNRLARKVLDQHSSHLDDELAESIASLVGQ